MKRESLGSRLGFILLSAGCAIGVGNVWRFPYMAGNYGGGAFMLFYIFFLLLVGAPILSMEFAIGRASQKSPVRAYQELEKPGQKWHIHGYVALFGNYVLMMFYTVVAGWMLYYFYSFATGKFNNLNTDQILVYFDNLLAEPKTMIFWMVLVIVLGFLVTSFGLQNGTERVTKIMMLLLFALMFILTLRSFTLPNASEGLKFYLIPDFNKMKEYGIMNTISGAMNQAFFTLSLGIGAMLIFASYLKKEHTLLKESITVMILDTTVAIMAGLIIFPATFSYGIKPDSGPSLIFITLPNVFVEMPLGNLWGSLFFLFMSFAAISTILAVFENIISSWMDLTKMSRKKIATINAFIITLLSIPCALGFNVWSGFQPLGPGTNILDLEDFVVSNLLLPIGSLIYLIFCVSRYGWGFSNYLKEANTGKGIKIPAWTKGYFKYVLPILLIILFIQGLSPLANIFK